MPRKRQFSRFSENGRVKWARIPSNKKVLKKKLQKFPATNIGTLIYRGGTKKVPDSCGISPPWPRVPSDRGRSPAKAPQKARWAEKALRSGHSEGRGAVAGSPAMGAAPASSLRRDRGACPPAGGTQTAVPQGRGAGPAVLLETEGSAGRPLSKPKCLVNQCLICVLLQRMTRKVVHGTNRAAARGRLFDAEPVARSRARTC